MIFIDSCFGKSTPYTPVWMMRQAGRYLPEYMTVRQKAGNFLNLCHNPNLASEVTLQPVDILGVDAAILFTDILLLPNEMGMELDFIRGFGPKFKYSIRTNKSLDNLKYGKDVSKKLKYVYETIKITKKKLDKNKALIGFAGSPWTVATYMIEGQGTKTYNNIKKLLYTNSSFVHQILKKVTETTKYYLEEQIKSGVDVIQIFDSWASALENSKYLTFSWNYMLEISDFIKTKYPHIPIILFPKGIPTILDKINGKFDVFGVDWGTPIDLAKEKLGEKYILQGNMEPCALYSKDEIKKSVQYIKSIMKNRRHIFNLGHGILPDVPVENAKYFIKICQET